jgi:probable HAF family extracellular repeat protein
MGRVMSIAALGFSVTAFAASYTVTDLGTLSGGTVTGSASFARGINNRGQVVGNSDGGRAFLYSDGSMRDLDPQYGGYDVANAINTLGQVVGYTYNPLGDTRAFLYSGGATMPVSSGESEALGINDNGQIVGWVSDIPFAPGHAFLLSNGTTTIIGPDALGSYSQANAVNARGQVVGFIAANYQSVSAQLHAFLFSDGVTIDLGTLGTDRQSSASAINANGQVVGTSDSHAFLYSGGVMSDLGMIADYSSFAGDEHFYGAVGINAAGQIVGSFGYITGVESGFGPPPGFGGTWLYSDGIMHDLNSLIDPSGGWSINFVAGINDAGQIAGTGSGPTGYVHALLLSPVISTVVEYANIEDFPGSPGGHFFYIDDPGEQAVVDSGVDGHFVRTGRTFNAGGSKRLCRFYGSAKPGPNSHFYTISDQECDSLKALQIVPTPTDVQQWNYEGLVFSEIPAQTGDAEVSCMAGANPVYRAYNNAYPTTGPKNPWDSAHRYSSNRADIEQLVSEFNWVDEGIAFCSPQ